MAEIWPFSSFSDSSTDMWNTRKKLLSLEHWPISDRDRECTPMGMANVKCLIYYNSHIGSDRWEWKVTLLQRMNIYKAQKSTSVELTMPVRKSDLQYHVLESITYGAVFWFLFNILLFSVYITYRWVFFLQNITTTIN